MQTLKNSELRYRRLFEAAQDGILILDAETGMIEDVNPYLIKMLGYSHAEFIKRKIWEVRAFKDIQASKDAFEVLQKNEYIRYENLPLRTKDGRLVQVEFVSNVYLVGDEKVIQCNIRDITARKQADASLRESEERYRLLVETLPDGVVVHSQGRIIFANRACATILGAASPADLTEKPIMEFIHPDYQEMVLKRVQQSLSEGSYPPLVEEKFVRQDGTLVDVEVSAIPISYDDKPAMLTVFNDITARKNTDEQIRYQAGLVGSVNDAIIATDAQYRLTVWNTAAESLYGWKAQEVLGRNGVEITGTEWPDVDARTMRHAIAELGCYRGEATQARKDGTRFPVEGSWLVLYGESGQITGYTSVIRDITERRRAEQTLHEGEKRFRALVENNSDAITLLDAKGKALYDSPAASGMLGYAPEDWIGRDVFALIHPDDLPEIRDLFQNLVGTPGARANSIFRLRHKSGSSLWIEMVATNLLAEPGVEAIVLNYRDITERKQAEQTTSRLAAIVESSDEAILGLTLNGDVASWNLAAQQLYGYSADEILGRPFSVCLLPENPDEVAQILERLKSGEHIGHFKTVRSRKDGQWIRVSAAMSVMRGVGGQIVGVSSIERDISQEERAEEVLRQLSPKEAGQRRTRVIGELITILPLSLLVFLAAYYFNLFGRFQAIIGNYNDTLLDEFLITAVFVVFALAIFSYRRWGESQSEIGRRQQAQEALHTLHDELEMRVQERTMDLVQTNAALKMEISQRQQMEQELSDSERHYRQMIETAAEGIWTIDAANRTTMANKSLAEMLGYSMKEIMAKSIFDFTDEEQQANAVAGLERRMQGINGQLDFKFKRKDGSTLWALMETSSLHDEAGNYTGMLAMLTDITQRKQAEEKIRRQLEHLKALSDIDRAISSSFDLPLNLATLLAHVTARLGIDAADVLLFDSASLTLEYGAGQGFHTRVIENVPIPLSKGYAARAIVNQQLVYIRDLEKQPDDSPRSALFVSEDFVSYYAVPMLAKGDINGVLEVFQRTLYEPDAEWLDFLKTLAGQCAIAIENATLFSRLQDFNTELTLAYDATIEGWSGALDLRDKETEGHSQRVTDMTLRMAQAMGVSPKELVHIRRGALLHDIGKMGIPDQILLKPGKLTEDEWEIMRKHPDIAYKLLSPIPFLKPALDIPYCHHEKWDGTGYPRGLKGEEIPLAARLFAVMDVWDAVCSDRPYRPAWTKEEARKYIKSLAGTHFDPQMVDIFMQMIH